MASAALLAGCAVGPDYSKPAPPAGASVVDAPLPDKFAASATLGGEAQAIAIGQDISGQWWTLFHSPALTALIDQGLRHSPTLQAAQDDLLAARQTARASAGGLFPTLSAAFGAAHERISGAGFGAGSSGTGTSTGTGAGAGGSTPVTTTPVFDLYTGSVNVSYALDLWGGVRRGVEQSQAQAEAQRYALEASYLTLTSNIVAAAIAEASLRAQIAATEQVLAAEADGLRVVQAQFDAGAVTRAEVLQQQTQIATTRATLPPLETSLAQERNLLASYVGAYPNQFQDPGITLASLALPTSLPVSLSSALVAQRPDIQQSAATLHAKTAAVGVATANLLPQVTLSGSYGDEALALSQVFSAGALAYTLAAQASQTLFQGGTLVHQRRAAIATMQSAAAQYQATVVNAFANVADALDALRYDAVGLQAALEAGRAAHDSLELTQAQFKAGSVNYLSVLTAQQADQTALITLARAQAARFADTAALFASLGGGWWNRSDVDPSTARCCGLLQ